MRAYDSVKNQTLKHKVWLLKLYRWSLRLPDWNVSLKLEETDCLRENSLNIVIIPRKSLAKLVSFSDDDTFVIQ